MSSGRPGWAGSDGTRSRYLDAVKKQIHHENERESDEKNVDFFSSKAASVVTSTVCGRLQVV